MLTRKPFEGYVLIKKIVCQNLSNVELLAKNDPFVQMQYGSTALSTDPLREAGRNATWEDLELRFNATETALRFDLLDLKVFNDNKSRPSTFIGDTSFQLSKLLDQVGTDVVMTAELRNKKDKKAGNIQITLSAYYVDSFSSEPIVRYVEREQILKEVSYERIILPRFKIQITEKFLESTRNLLATQLTFMRPKIESYGLTTRFIGLNDAGTIEIREEGTRKLDKEIATGHKGSIRRLCLWQGDGATFIITAGSDGTARVFDFDSGKYLRNMVGHEGPVLCVAASDDGDVKKTLVATGGVDCTVRVYYLSSGRQRVALSGHAWRVVSICFTDPKFTVGHVSVIASMDVKGEIRLWDRETGMLLRVLNAQTPVDRNQLPI